MKNTIVTFCSLFIVLIQAIQAQNAPVVTIGNVVMSGTTVTVPITATGFTSITACNLNVIYDSTLLHATSVSIGTSVGGNINSNITVHGKIFLGWYTSPGVTVANNTTIFNIVFQKVGIGSGLVSLAFFSDSIHQCVFSTVSIPSLNQLPFTNYYHNGSISVLPANAPHTIASVLEANTGNTVSVPVKVTSFKFVGALSLTLNYNSSVLTYASVVNNASYPGLSVNSSVAGTLVISGSSSAFNGVILADSATLFTLNFTYQGGTSSLSWFDNGTSCKYSGPLGSPVYNDTVQSTYYINGAVVPTPAITGNATVCPNTTQTYSVPYVSSYTYQWVINGGVIQSGANTNSVNVKFNNVSNGSISIIQTYLNTPLPTSKNISIYSMSVPVVIGNQTVSANNKNETYNTSDSTNTYLWAVTEGTILNGQGTYKIKIDWSSCITCTSGTVSVTETTVNGCSATTILNVVLSDTGNILSGQLLYKNSSNTPLNGVTIQLINSSNAVIATTITAPYTYDSIPNFPITIAGYYSFNNTHNGNYKLRATSTLTWGGANSTDALLIKKHTVALSLLSGLPLVAADVNKSNTVNSTDALLVQLRNIGSINQFAAGDWVYMDTLTSVAGSTNHNISSLATGDVNGSYAPSSKKAVNFTSLQKEGVVRVSNGHEIDLPIRVNENIKTGAITLDISYDNNLIEVTDLTSLLNGLVYTISGGKIKISWCDINAVSLQANDVLFTLKVKVKSVINNTNDLFSIGDDSEFADDQGNIIQVSPFKVNSIEMSTKNNSISVYPNPFRDNIDIEYNLMESGRIMMVLYNAVGQTINVLADEYKTAGTYSLHFSTSNLAKGVYTIVIIDKGETSNYQKALKLIKTN